METANDIIFRLMDERKDAWKRALIFAKYADNACKALRSIIDQFPDTKAAFYAERSLIANEKEFSAAWKEFKSEER